MKFKMLQAAKFQLKKKIDVTEFSSYFYSSLLFTFFKKN